MISMKNASICKNDEYDGICIQRAKTVAIKMQHMVLLLLIKDGVVYDTILEGNK